MCFSRLTLRLIDRKNHWAITKIFYCPKDAFPFFQNDRRFAYPAEIFLKSPFDYISVDEIFMKSLADYTKLFVRVSGIANSYGNVAEPCTAS